MKSTTSFLFAFLLTGLVHNTSSQHSNFVDFLHCLNQSNNAQTLNDLPFVLKNSLIENLYFTSNDFQSLCVKYDNQYFHSDGRYSSVLALIKAINHIFHLFKARANGYIYLVDQIQSVDPIGLNIYLTNKNEISSSPTFMNSIMEYYGTMTQRLRLHNMRSNLSCYDIFDGNHNNPPLQAVHIQARNEITTEFTPLRTLTVDRFAKLVKEQTNMKMYPGDDEGKVKFRKHNPSNDDVQILYGTGFDQNNPNEGHAICIYYRAATQMVEVYDSAQINRLSESQLTAIYKLYPKNKGIDFKTPKTLQGYSRTCAIFAIAYATMLLHQRNPEHTPITLNTVYGDDTLYMRIHLLNMLANRKLALFG